MKTPIMNRRQFLSKFGGTALTFPWFSHLALHGAEDSLSLIHI